MSKFFSAVSHLNTRSRMIRGSPSLGRSAAAALAHRGQFLPVLQKQKKRINERTRCRADWSRMIPCFSPASMNSAAPFCRVVMTGSPARESAFQNHERTMIGECRMHPGHVSRTIDLRPRSAIRDCAKKETGRAKPRPVFARKFFQTDRADRSRQSVVLRSKPF